ncbi:adenylate/guanylate cyclase domain-containing protein [Prosthecomicrobium sp. N25]|uniref:adenylate/guanylate cyclase domain-containing protein n=1 Tax=Prosthecomicrobium sp. N25 TaxID=3129254 RepID=UPI003077241F
MKRRLSAVLALDVVGSSRLIQADESGALRAIRAVFDTIVGPAVTRHSGRTVKTMGDGALIEFGSPVEAVLAAVETQTTMATWGGTPAIVLRIGINMGDVAVDDDGDIFGDSVNVAARLQEVADPGGLCVSDKVFNELEGKLALPFEDGGERQLKNIARQIRVYRLKPGAASTDEPKSVRPSLDRGDRPSIAVLPFANLSGDPEQEYLADGIADDVTTALARSRWLFVMSRNSSFAFRGRAMLTDEIARLLGVRYVLTGSLRRSGSRLRISAQLIEAETGGSIWAERYDRDMGDLFALQDEITEAVAGAIEPELLKKEGQRGADRPRSLTAWDLVRRGMWEFHKIRPETHWTALDLFREATRSAPEFADGFFWASRAATGIAAYGWTEKPGLLLDEALATATRAIQLDERNPYAHYALGIAELFRGATDKGLAAARRAVALNPSFALGYFVLGMAELQSGRALEGAHALEHGLRLSPFDPQNFTWSVFLALAYCFSGDPAKGLDDARRALVLRPGWPAALAAVALCSSALEDREGARTAAKALRNTSEAEINPVRSIVRCLPDWSAALDRALNVD